MTKEEFDMKLDAILEEALSQAWFARGAQQAVWTRIKKDATKKLNRLMKEAKLGVDHM